MPRVYRTCLLFFYVSAAPNPVGVGQNVIIVTSRLEIPPTTPTDFYLFLEHPAIDKHGKV